MHWHATQTVDLQHVIRTRAGFSAVRSKAIACFFVRCCCRCCPTAKATKEVDEGPKFVAFSGGGSRLDGKKSPPKAPVGGADEKGQENSGPSRQGMLLVVLRASRY